MEVGDHRQSCLGHHTTECRHDERSIYYIETGHRFVSQHDFRLLHERPGNPDPLLLAAAQFIGANIGYGWGDFEQAFDAEVIILGPLSEGFDADGDGILGGAQAGFNWQTGQFVFGVEVDVQAVNIDGGANRFFDFGLATLDADVSTEIDWFGTARGRIGFVPTERLMVYGTGGFAFGETTSSASYDAGIFGSDSASSKDTRTGWAAGAGAEYAFADNWTLKAEYLYVDLGEETFLNLVEPGLLEADLTSDVTLQTVRLGINYKF